MINLNLFQLVDMAFDSAAQRLAQNFSCNLETVVQNRAAREQSESSEEQHVRQISITGETLNQSREGDPLGAVHSQLPRKELEKRLEYLMDELDYQAKDKTLFIA